MAEPHSNARSRADAGAPTSGVIHVRTRLTANFTVIANALAQRPGSAVTVGVATYILSLPDGAPVSIAALCEHFTEGEILISRALKDLERAGYLERRRERGPGGLIRTRTCFHDVPIRELAALARPSRPTGDAAPAPAQALRPEAAPSPEPEPAPARPQTEETPPAPAPASPSAPAPAPAPAPSSSSSLAEADPQAVVILASLRIADPRLILSRRDVTELAPAVAQWLAEGVGPAQITRALTSGLPDHFRTRPARILAYRLSEPPIATPTRTPTPRTSAALPWQTCDGGCERAFRATAPGHCRDCSPDNAMPSADTA
ncbi:hypothetical protein [Streptomyces hypolithicus]